jgi:N-acetylglucosamine-6-phosphate deacetylase
MIIENVTILTPEVQILAGAVATRGEKIAAVGRRGMIAAEAGARVFDGRGLILAPGFIDVQINGGFGLDFTEDATSIWKVGKELGRYGVTGFLATIITAPEGRRQAALKAYQLGPPTGYQGAQLLGLHFEGPFLNPKRKGAHPARYLGRPEATELESWSAEEGVRLATLAPELEGAEEVVRRLSTQGVVVSAGHSLASAEQAEAAFQAGVRGGTHLFNAMEAITARAPGLAGALLTRRGVKAGLIVDGLHVHPAMVRLAWEMKGKRGELFLVSDAMAALGMPEGRYRLGEDEVEVKQGAVRLADGTLAGSTLSMDVALRKLMAFTGCSLAEALPALTSVPAELLGLKTKGRIEAGYDADFVLLTEQGGVAATLVKGELITSNFGDQERKDNHAPTG